MSIRITVALAGLLIAAAAPSARAAKPTDVFTITKVWQFQIGMTAKEYEAMQPAPGGFGFPGGPPMPMPEKKPGERETHRSVFGTDFPVAHATISTEGETVEDVAIRYKGNSTYLATARNLKRSLKIDIDHSDADKQLLGLKMLILHCGAHDPSKLREALAYGSTARRACRPRAPRSRKSHSRCRVSSTRSSSGFTRSPSR